MMDALSQIEALGVVPVVVMENAANAVPLGQALLEGGLPCAEITFRTATAAEAIRALTATYPDLLVGAGTILTVKQARAAASAGAEFIVTPGFDMAVVDWCLANGLPVTPGVMTPTDINQALNKSLSVLKFFPAEAVGGVKTLKAISAPYGGVRFIPTGGINLENLSDYLSLPAVVACGGSWLVKKQLIADGEFERIRDLAAEAVGVVQQVRS